MIDLPCNARSKFGVRVTKGFMRLFMVFALALAMTGCMKHLPLTQADRMTCTGEQPSAEVSLRLQEKRLVNFCNQASLNLLLTDIVSDSRCPLGLECFSAGSAVVQLGIDGQPYLLDVYNSLKPNKVTVQIDGHLFTVTALELSPLFDHFVDISTIDKSQYRLKLRIERQ